MENTLENKSKFYAQYWGQDVLEIPEDEQTWNLFDMEDEDGESIVPKSNLLLTPLAAITDEDAIEVANILGYPDDYFYVKAWGVDRIQHVKNRANKLWDDAHLSGKKLWFVLDYLRSRGYALPYLDASVEDLVKMGWVKLKNHE